jgi:CheY-like chemotaxis protein
MGEREETEPLADLDEVLEGLLRAVHADRAHDLDESVQRYLEEAIDAAMVACGRARDGRLGAPGAVQVQEALAVARALLAELRGSRRRSWAIVERSLELRRQAIRLTAAGLALSDRSSRTRRESTELLAAPTPVLDRLHLPPLHRVRVLLVRAVSGSEHAKAVANLLATIGAEMRVAASVPEAVLEARQFHPEVLVCDVPFDVGERLVCELRREGVIAPALAVTTTDDTVTRTAGRAAGFADILVAPLSTLTLSRALRAALGA